MIMNQDEQGQKLMSLEQLKQTAEQLENADSSLDPFAYVTADKEFIYFPQEAKKRRHLNKWRDATP